jgi:hypothetical protein
VAVYGVGGHRAAFRFACDCVRFGLCDAEALAFLREYNSRCRPPWEEFDLVRTLAGARRAAGQNKQRLSPPPAAVRVTWRVAPHKLRVTQSVEAPLPPAPARPKSPNIPVAPPPLSGSYQSGSDPSSRTIQGELPHLCNMVAWGADDKNGDIHRHPLASPPSKGAGPHGKLVMQAKAAEFLTTPQTSGGQERLPFLDSYGAMHIPFDGPERYHWWKSDDNLSPDQTLAEVVERLAAANESCKQQANP